MDLPTLAGNSLHIFFLGCSCKLKPSEAFSSRFVRKEHGLVQSPMDRWTYVAAMECGRREAQTWWFAQTEKSCWHLSSHVIQRVRDPQALENYVKPALLRSTQDEAIRAQLNITARST